MYSEWPSLQRDIRSDTSHKSVLSSFPEAVGHEVANAIVRNLAQSLSIGALSGEPSTLNSEKQVKWTMEVLFHIFSSGVVVFIKAFENS